MEVAHAQLQVVRHQVVGAAATRRDARRRDLLHSLLHQRLHLRVGLLARVAHALREVAGADEIHVHAGDVDQLGDVLDGLHFLQHQAHQRVAVRVGHVVGRGLVESVLRRPAAAEKPAIAVRVVLHRLHRRPRLLGRVDVWHLHAPRAPVQERRDDLRTVAHGPHDGRGARVFGGADHVLGQVNGDAPVLVVDQHPVVAQEPQHLHHRRRWEGDHRPEHRLSRGQLCLHRVFAHVAPVSCFRLSESYARISQPSTPLQTNTTPPICKRPDV